MAIVAMWQCDRDGTMFASKKDAEAYDKMLELAHGFSQLIEAHATDISTEDAEAIGLLLAQHKDRVMAACKGKTDELEALAEEDLGELATVTPIAAVAKG